MTNAKVLTSVNDNHEHADRELAKRVTVFLSSARPEFAGMEIRVEGGRVHLSGRASSYYHRQLAVACVRRVAGVREINDQLQVPCEN